LFYQTIRPQLRYFFPNPLVEIKMGCFLLV
jgi:hypothetical protein